MRYALFTLVTLLSLLPLLTLLKQLLSKKAIMPIYYKKGFLALWAQEQNVGWMCEWMNDGVNDLQTGAPAVLNTGSPSKCMMSVSVNEDNEKNEMFSAQAIFPSLGKLVFFMAPCGHSCTLGCLQFHGRKTIGSHFPRLPRSRILASSLFEPCIALWVYPHQITALQKFAPVLPSSKETIVSERKNWKRTFTFDIYLGTS